jgi:mycothiol synthase
VPELRIRRLAADDEVALDALIARAAAAGELLGSSDPHAEWITRYAVSEPRHVGAAEIDGGLVGAVLPEIKTIVVDPGHRRRGIGRALVEEGIAIERERERPNLLVGVLPEDAAGRAFLEATEFAFHSTLWDLDLASGVAVAAPSWPDDVRTRPIDRGRDLRAFVALFNAAFADHATPLQLDADRMAANQDVAPFRDEDLLLLERPSGELVGFCATEPKRRQDGGVEARGEIWTVGVRPDHQGHGYGRQLLRWGVGHLREVGVETVTLSVNGRNPRALGLYESEGFRRTTTRDRWAKPVFATSAKGTP